MFFSEAMSYWCTIATSNITASTQIVCSYNRAWKVSAAVMQRSCTGLINVLILQETQLPLFATTNKSNSALLYCLPRLCVVPNTIAAYILAYHKRLIKMAVMHALKSV